MRYILVDRITAVEPGRQLLATKYVSASDALAETYGAGMPALPAAMMLESMAQAAGLLVVRSLESPCQPVLAKVHGFAVTRMARAGDRVDLHASLEDLRPEGCRAQVMAKMDGEVIASGIILLALVPITDVRQQVRLTSHLAGLFPDWFPTAMRSGV